MNVPDVQYKSQEEAEEMLRNNGLVAEIRQESSTTVAAGNVIRQDIEAGTKLEKGETVVIYISTGAPARRQNNNGGRENLNQGAGQTSPPVQTQAAPPQTQAAPPQTQAPPPQTQAPAAYPARNPAFDLLN